MKNNEFPLVLLADLFPFHLIQTFFRFPQGFDLWIGLRNLYNPLAHNSPRKVTVTATCVTAVARQMGL